MLQAEHSFLYFYILKSIKNYYDKNKDHPNDDPVNIHSQFLFQLIHAHHGDLDKSKGSARTTAWQTQDFYFCNDPEL